MKVWNQAKSRCLCIVVIDHFQTTPDFNVIIYLHRSKLNQFTAYFDISYLVYRDVQARSFELSNTSVINILPTFSRAPNTTPMTSQNKEKYPQAFSSRGFVEIGKIQFCVAMLLISAVELAVEKLENWPIESREWCIQEWMYALNLTLVFCPLTHWNLSPARGNCKLDRS